MLSTGNTETVTTSFPRRTPMTKPGAVNPQLAFPPRSCGVTAKFIYLRSP